MFLPVWVLGVQLFILHVALLLEQLEDLLWPACLSSVIKESRLLKDEPLPQILIPAVGESADEMRNVVIRSLFAVVASLLDDEAFAEIVEAFNVQLVLLGELVDFLGEVLPLSILVRIIQELNLFQYLQSTNSNLLELVNSNHLMRWLIVH